jgi:Dolichyl-phosphate-mannose-protein mannosyltransferase
MRFRIAAALCAGVVLFCFTRLNYAHWPLPWPDEALFSSPAAALAAGEGFRTPVLAGLIPGMERATLWNSPLYMTLTGLVYALTGESQPVARSVSLAAGFFALFVFAGLAGTLLENRRLAFIAPTLVALDPVFQRAANVARMDMLTLLFYFSAIHFFVRISPAASSPLPGRRKDGAALIGGAAVGLAASSHPIAVLLAPIALCLLLPDLRRLALAVLGALLALGPWLIYIARNFALFELQFVSQLVRKQSIATLFGGDTGGVFVVYAAQFGGGRILMIAALLAAGTALAGGFFLAWRRRNSPAGQMDLRLALAAGATFGLALAASEAWYPIYVTPLLLCLALRLVDRTPVTVRPLAEFDGAPRPRTRPLYKTLAERAPLWLLAGTLIAGALTITINGVRLDLPLKIANALNLAVDSVAAAGCRSVYLRVRPDPYFALRRAHPALEILEFVPGKLQFDADPGSGANQTAYLRERYKTIDCFLLDDNAAWEPILSAYLVERRSEFRVKRLPIAAPLEPMSLWQRSPVP